MAESGLDFDLMEQMELEHRDRIEKVRNMTVKPHCRSYMKGSELLSPDTSKRGGKNKLLDSAHQMDRVTEEEADSARFSDRKRGNSF